MRQGLFPSSMSHNQDTEDLLTNEELLSTTFNEEKRMTEETKDQAAGKKRSDENVIYVGHKPPMSYVLAVVTQFQSGTSDEVVIKARGRAISTAVDTAEIVRNRFVTDAHIKEITIGTESVTNEEGRTSNVSSMEICLTKKKKLKKKEEDTEIKDEEDK